ncbi:hypothetical protein CRG98_014111 [Punica granatum]|uniref:Uncharacterized protein n=1 Tax=Punica granatum TaxID=22663 RepID=A0A2I0KAE5_PUNGR|nr:hypothetical protein CRG98_014111 [Punica granatum]
MVANEKQQKMVARSREVVQESAVFFARGETEHGRTRMEKLQSFEEGKLPCIDEYPSAFGDKVPFQGAVLIAFVGIKWGADGYKGEVSLTMACC